MKPGYTLAGRVNRTLAALEAAILPAFPDASSAAATFAGYLLAKSVYMLLMVAVTGGAKCKPEFYLNSPAFIAYLLRPEFECAQVKGIKGVVVPAESALPPLAEIEAMCLKLNERSERNRENMGLGVDSELEELGLEAESEMSVGFYDDSSFDDINIDDWNTDDDDDEVDDDEGAWSDEEAGLDGVVRSRGRNRLLELLETSMGTSDGFDSEGCYDPENKKNF